MALTAIDYTALKTAMRTKHYPVSAGNTWTANDAKLLRDFCYLQGVDQVTEFYGQPYTGLLPDGFPGKPAEGSEGGDEPESLVNTEVNTDTPAPQGEQTNPDTPAPESTGSGTGAPEGSTNTGTGDTGAGAEGSPAPEGQGGNTGAPETTEPPVSTGE